MFRKENHCLVQYIVDKYGDTAHKFAIGLKAYKKDIYRREGLATLAILPRTILKKRKNSSFCFKWSWCNSSYYSNRPVQNSKGCKELNKFCPS